MFSEPLTHFSWVTMRNFQVSSLEHDVSVGILLPQAMRVGACGSRCLTNHAPNTDHAAISGIANL